MIEAGRAAEQRSNKYRIAGMDCGDCAITIESSIGHLPGVEAATVSFTNQTMEVIGNIGANAIEHRLTELGYRLVKDSSQTGVKPPEHRGIRGFVEFLWAQPPLRRAMFVAGAILIGLVALVGRPPIAGVAPIDLLFATAVLISGGPVFLKGIRAALFARRITIDLLMAIAAAGALAIGATGEAVTVILLFILGEAMEAYSAERARGSLRSLMALQPQEATVLGAQDSGANDHQTVMPVDQVCVGDRVLIRPGQRVPIDGKVIEGTSSINQAPVTGESMPVVKSIGDEVMAGTVNGEAALEIGVTRIAADGTIARIAKLVEQAHAQRSPAERFIDRFARWYTPAVVVLAALVVAIPVLAFGLPLLDTTDDTPGWLYRGLAILIIACPCALVISIPVTVVSGLTRLANLGVLVKSGAHLDRLADIRAVAFDKTGTLTHGRPTVTGVWAAIASIHRSMTRIVKAATTLSVPPRPSSERRSIRLPVRSSMRRKYVARIMTSRPHDRYAPILVSVSAENSATARSPWATGICSTKTWTDGKRSPRMPRMPSSMDRRCCMLRVTTNLSAISASATKFEN